ncbi:MAG: hypothetical protein UT39_C0006G0005 [Candidatus Woesebacteria bacterium GW2011_GWA1_39_21]|uniref:Glycosyltransferase RgtA/B/C/D-like domain-containing protein n=1 Tax=Candidatus Woesebacteria bacterium GW2011_GWA1_39_21 TaxID=1618550 RepID=A0A0G0N5J5_9BACT|nr:MAG: hypothetical protein UT39_C0006G0005 [Candidatus Woesebacteria bacterium GW2011_GWA1_39_21]
MSNRSNIIKINVLLMVTFIITTVVLGIIVKGVAGNLSANDVYNLQARTQPFELSPERGRFAIVQSLFEYRRLDFPKEVARYVIPDLAYRDGKFVTLFPPGVSFISSPLYYLGKQFNYSQYFSFLTVSIFAIINVFLIFKIVALLTSNKYAGILAGLIFLFSTTALPYAITLYQHHFTTFFILLSLFLFLKKKSITSLLLSYFKFIDIKVGKKIIVKLSYSIFVAFLAFVVGIIPNLAFSKYVYGNMFQLAGTVRGVKNVQVLEPDIEAARSNSEQAVDSNKSLSNFFQMSNVANGFQVLIASSERGFVFYAPVMLLSIFVIFVFSKSSDDNKKTIRLVFVVQLLILILYLMWGDPWGGWAFGPRYLIPLFSCNSILLGVVLNKYGKNLLMLALFSVLFIYGLAVNTAGALTTNALAPSKEVESASLPKVQYMFNFQMISDNHSSSFVYNNLLNQYFDLKTFFFLIISVVSVLYLINLILLYRSEYEN